MGTRFAVDGYKAIVEGYDWGPALTKIVLDVGQPIKTAYVNKGEFSVRVVRRSFHSGEIVKALDWATMETYDSVGELKVLDAYLSDAAGTKSSAAEGSHIALALEAGPDIRLGSPLNFELKTFLNSFVDVQTTVVIRGGLTAPETIVPPSAKTANTYLVADDFDTKGVSEYSDDRYGRIVLRYASYMPANARDGAKHPLLIWLHGAGEGGADPRIALLGNRVTALAEEPIQRIMGGAYVLAPQSPIVWMNNGTKSYPEDGSTQYTKALKACIDAYIANTPGIDSKRIYIGGCSNGGYMTVNMLLNYPDFFAAAYPICEAYADKWISDGQISAIKGISIWFTQAKTDTIVNAAQGGYVVETYDRLKAAGAKDVHLSYWDKVEDLSGRWFKADGATPYEYNGHWSWIYALNNQCTKDFDGSLVELNGAPTTLFEWLAAKSR